MTEHTRIRSPLTWGRRIGYGSGDFACNLYWQSNALFLYFYYTDVVGMAPLMAGISFAIASVYDAISDPIMGSIADRTRTRWGRYRPYILLGSIPCAIFFAAMFFAVPFSGLALVMYATLTHMLFRTFYTAINIPYLAMSANLTSNSGERSTLAGVRMVFAALGALVIAFAFPKAVSALTGSVAQPYFAVAAIVGLIATLLLFVCFLTTRENDFTDNAAPAPLTLRSVFQQFGHDVIKFWGMLSHNEPLARIFGAIVVISVALTMFSKCVLYWFKYGLHQPELSPVALVIPALMLIVCAPLWVWFAKRFSKRDAWMLGSALAFCGLLGFYFNESTEPIWVLGWIFVFGIGTSAYAIMYWAMLPDTVEFNELTLGERNEAKVVGFAAFAQKTALAINALVLGQALEWVGYVANQPLSSDTLSGIKAVMCLVPVAGVVFSVLILWRYPITPEFHQSMVDELEERDRLRNLATVS